MLRMAQPLRARDGVSWFGLRIGRNPEGLTRCQILRKASQARSDACMPIGQSHNLLLAHTDRI